MGIHYTIISRPDHIQFLCPHCKRDVEVPFQDVVYNTKLWVDGAFCTCPYCEEEVELEDYKYD